MPKTVAMRPSRGSAGRSLFVDIRLVNVVCPHRVEAVTLPAMPDSEAGEQRGQPKPENSSGK